MHPQWPWDLGQEIQQTAELDPFHPKTLNFGRLSWQVSCSNVPDVQDSGLGIRVKDLDKRLKYSRVRENVRKGRNLSPES